MPVTFTRTGARRYGIEAAPAGGPVMRMIVAPGWDPALPHDLAHLLVERAAGLRLGVFGQLAAGGDAGTFHAVPHPRDPLPHRRRSARLGKLGAEDMGRSEELAGALLLAFHGAGGTPGAAARAALGDLAAPLLEEARAVAVRWRAVPVGGSLTLDWPPRRR
jgi:hypothetical protein